MSVSYWIGYVIGTVLFWSPFAAALLLLVPRVRRRVLRPLARRRAARRRREYLARQAVIEARTGLLEAQAELADIEGTIE